MQESNLEFTNDRSRMDVELIHNFLNDTYWAQGRSLKQVKKSIENSQCYAAFHGENQIAFARVVTDCVAFAYVMDVFVLPEFRGRGIATKLMNHVLADPELAEVALWQLKTRDAHELYRRIGFKPLEDPELLMRFTREQT